LDRVVDFHNHVLHGIDDGPKSLDSAIDMVTYAASTGITDIVNTTHINHPRIDTSMVTRELLETKVSEIKSNLPDHIRMNIHISSEVYFSHDLKDRIDESLMIYNDKYILIEFPIINFPSGFEDVLFDILLSGYIPVIAHPERYRVIQTNIKFIDKLVSMGCIVQIDAGSIIGGFGSVCKDTALRLLSSGNCHLIGSDAHDTSKRGFCLLDAIDLLSDTSKDLSEALLLNAQNILDGSDLEKDMPLVNFSQKKLLTRIKGYFNEKN